MSGPAMTTPEGRVDGHNDHEQTVFGQVLAVTQDSRTNVANAQAIDQHTAGRHRIAQTRRFFPDFDGAADFADDDIFLGHAHLFTQVRVHAQHAVFAMDRDEVLGPAQGKHQLLLLLAGVAGNVQGRIAVVDDLGALLVQLVDHVVDRLLIARNGRRRDKDAVARYNLHLLVAVVGHAVQGRHGFALGTGRNDHQLFPRVTAHFVHVDHDLGFIGQIAQFRPRPG